MGKVLVIDTEKKPLNPIHPAQARQLLTNKKAAIYRRFPFTLILTEAKPNAVVEALRIKIDPGSRITGFFSSGCQTYQEVLDIRKKRKMNQLSKTFLASTIIVTGIGAGYLGTQYFGRKTVQILGISLFGSGVMIQVLRSAPEYRKLKFLLKR